MSMFDLDDLRLHLGQSLDLPADLAAKTFRQGTAIRRDQFRRRQGLVVCLDVDAANTLSKQKAFDPVDVGGPLPDQSIL